MRVAVFAGSARGDSPAFHEAAKRFGSSLAKASVGIVYGGGHVGLMGAVADGFVALPGGVGTLDEWFEAWTWGRLGLHAKRLALLDVDGLWRPLATMLDHLVNTGFLGAHHRDSIVIEGDAQRLLEGLRSWTPPASQWVGRAARR